MPKVLNHEELLALRSAARARGETVVQCHGCFDIVHPGHVRHLKQAKGLGTLLLVSITGDSGVGKGAGRPLIPEELRAENLAALDFVDWVYVEHRPTAEALLDEVRPDVYVKGREYELNNDPRFRAERETVERRGGRVVFSSGDVVFSSTALIAAIEQSVDPFHARLSQLLERPELQGPALSAAITGFRGKRVVIVGETILDTYVLCDRPSVAGESPVMTLRPVERRQYDGGAAILARHVAAMGAKPVLVTALPRDPAADAVRRRLLTEGVEVRAIETDHPVPEKQRFLVGAQKVMKVDLCEPYVLDAAQQERLVALAEDAASDGGSCHAAIVADFGLGLLTPGVLVRLVKALRRRVPFISGDISGRRSNLRAMRGLDLLCPSEAELRDAYGMFDEGLPTVTWRLMEETRAKSALVTMGPEGLIAFEPIEGKASGYDSRVRGEHVPSLTPYAIDALGCGDSLLAATTLARAGGASILAAAFLGSVAAATQAQRIGNIPISAADLRQGLARVHNARLTFAAPEVVASRTAALRA